MTKKHIFLDTMMYLHYRPIDEVDWARLVCADEVVIVVAGVTAQELDKHKNSHANRKIRDRAHSILGKLEKWTAVDGNPIIRDHVLICYLPLWPDIDFTRAGLNKDSNDDVLLATILKYREHEPDVVLISADTVPRLNARHMGISTFSPPDDLKLPGEPDPLEKENAALKRQVQQLTSAVPVLNARFVGTEGNGMVLRCKLPLPPPFSKTESDATLAEVRKKYPVKTPGKTSGHAEGALDALRRRSAIPPISMIGMPLRNIDTFSREVDEYMTEYERYLRRLWEWRTAQHRTIPIVIEICKSGRCPADDVDVSFHFPNGFTLSEQGKDPQRPRPPEPPMTADEKMLRSLRSGVDSMAIAASFPAMEIDTTFRIRKTNSYVVEDKFRRIKHGASMKLQTLYACFNTYEVALSFAIDYELRPANLPEPVIGRLNVIVEKAAEPTAEE